MATRSANRQVRGSRESARSKCGWLREGGAQSPARPTRPRRDPRRGWPWSPRAADRACLHLTLRDPRIASLPDCRNRRVEARGARCRADRGGRVEGTRCGSCCRMCGDLAARTTPSLRRRASGTGGALRGCAGKTSVVRTEPEVALSRGHPFRHPRASKPPQNGFDVSRLGR